MPTPYIFGQTPLENYAINGNPKIWGSTGRLWLIQQSKVGTGKSYLGPYKNPIITGKKEDAYNLSHPNSISDDKTPSYGKGTNQPIDDVNTYNGVVARLNYKGGNFEDINGVTVNNVALNDGSGRNGNFSKNLASWGYGPGKEYTKPDITKNNGKVIYP